MITRASLVRGPRLPPTTRKLAAGPCSGATVGSPLVAGQQRRQLTVVAAADLSAADVQGALDGSRPLAVLPDGPAAVVDAALRALRPEEPLEEDADLVVVTSGSSGGARGVLLSAEAMRKSALAAVDRLGGPGSWVLALPLTAIAGL